MRKILKILILKAVRATAIHSMMILTILRVRVPMVTKRISILKLTKSGVKNTPKTMKKNLTSTTTRAVKTRWRAQRVTSMETKAAKIKKIENKNFAVKPASSEESSKTNPATF